MVCLLLSPSDAHQIDPRLSSFIISQGDSASQTVTVDAVDGVKYVCKFDYTVLGEGGAPALAPAPAPAPKPPVASPAPAAAASAARVVNVMSLLPSLPCVTRTEGYWTYEICSSAGTIKQRHGGDVYVIATKAVPHTNPAGTANTIDFTEGQVCEAKPEIRRTAKVKYHCSKQANPPRIISLSETSSCVYEFNVATANVCGDSRYPTVADEVVNAAPMRGNPVPTPAAAFVLSAADKASEDWNLEVIQLDRGAIMCSAHTTELRAENSALQFQSFTLSIRKGTDVANAGQATPEQCRHVPEPSWVVRRPGRAKAGDNEVEEKPRGTIMNTGTFQHKLAFVKGVVDTCWLN